MYKKKVYLYKDSEPMTIIYDTSLGEEGYIKEADRIKRAILNDRITVQTDYYIQDRITLSLMDN